MRFSASRFILYSDCSLKYKFNYVDELRVPAISPHLAYGSAVHKGIETINLSIKAGQLTAVEDALQSFHDEYAGEILTMGIKEDDYYKNKLYYHGVNTIIKFYETMLEYDVIDAEMEFEVPLLGTDGKQIKDHTIYGLIDAIIKRKKNGEVIIVDYKTAKEKYNMFKLDTSLQLAIYADAFRQLLADGKVNIGRKKKEDFIAYYLLLKDYETLDGDIAIQRKAITQPHLDRMRYIVETCVKGIDEGIFVPNYNSQCHWCEYKKNCLEFTGGTKV